MSRHYRDRRRHAAPSSIDPEFAQALQEARRGFEGRRDKPDYKPLQLCRQVQRVLNLEFEARGGHPALGGLYVQCVSPAAGAAHLLVHVVIPSGQSAAQVLHAIDQVAPALRLEVAQAITRKRAPRLTYLPAADGKEVDDGQHR
jgi:ribosome-binding factor A